MAKITGPLMSLEAHGTIGPRLTFSSRKTGQQVRFQNRQVDAQSSAQLEQRLLFDYWRGRWNDLSSAAKKVYEDYTIEHKLNMTGYNYYLKTNISATFFEDNFSGTSLDTDKWNTFGTGYGTIAVADGVCTITNSTGGNQDNIGIYSVMRFPIGVSFKARVKQTAGIHQTAIALGESPFATYPHGYGNKGTTGYLYVATTGIRLSLRKEDNTTTFQGIEPASFNCQAFFEIELKRVSKNLIEFYVEGTKMHEWTSADLDKDYYLYFPTDGYTTPSTLVIDWVKVEA